MISSSRCSIMLLTDDERVQEGHGEYHDLQDGDVPSFVP